jgi:hypothetical protein
VKLDQRQLHWYTVEIATHCSAALTSYPFIKELASDSQSHRSGDIWFLIQSFLTHSAMVSKILAPPKKNENWRGKVLRMYLEVAEDSEILSRYSRDNLEHLDERITRWVNSGKMGFVKLVFQDRIGYNYVCSPDTAVSRALIADEMDFVSENQSGIRQELKLDSLAQQLTQLSRICQKKIETESPYTFFLAAALRGTNLKQRS